MGMKELAACLAAGCLLWSGLGTASARHLAERRADAERQLLAQERLAAERRAAPEAAEAKDAWAREQEAAEAQADAAAAQAEDDEAEDGDAEETAEEAAAAIATAAESAEEARQAPPVAAGQGLLRQHLARLRGEAAAAEPVAEPEEKSAPAEDSPAEPAASAPEEKGILRQYLERLRGESAGAESVQERRDAALPPPAAEPHPVAQTPPSERAPKDEGRPLRTWPAERVDGGGTLLFSDSPEYVEQAGILYRDEVIGAARVLFYHVNKMAAPLKAAVVLENTSGRPVMLQVTRRGVSRPDSDYLSVGKATQAAYFSDAARPDKIILGTGEKTLLLPELEKLPLQPEQLIYGVADFSVSGAVRVSVLLCPTARDAIAFSRTAPVLPKDAHRLRGTFRGMDRTLRALQSYDPAKDGAVYLMLGDDKADPFLLGIDATDGSLVKNTGNYGVLYRVAVPLGGRGAVRALLNPIGGVYAGFMRSYRAGGSQLRLIPTPLQGTFFGHGVKNPVPMRGDTPLLDGAAAITDLGLYRPAKDLIFEFSPPGASNLPVRLILLPEGQE